jgi:hypothetical protein
MQRLEVSGAVRHMYVIRRQLTGFFLLVILVILSSFFFYLFIFYLIHEYLDDSILHQLKQRFCIVFLLYTTQAAVKVLQAAKKSPLVRQCQKSLNDISTRHTVGLYWVPGRAGLQGNEIADKLTRDRSVQKFVGPEPFFGVSRQNIKKDKTLDGQPAFGNVAWSLQYTKKDSRIELRT